MKFLHLPAFLISLTLGLLYVYLMPPESKVVSILPTPENIDTYLIKDKTGTCHTFEKEEVECDTSEENDSFGKYLF